MLRVITALQQFSYHFLNVSEQAVSSLLRAQQTLVCHRSSLLTFARPATEMSYSPAEHRQIQLGTTAKSLLTGTSVQPITVDCDPWNQSQVTFPCSRVSRPSSWRCDSVLFAVTAAIWGQLLERRPVNQRSKVKQLYSVNVTVFVCVCFVCVQQWERVNLSRCIFVLICVFILVKIASAVSFK